MDPDVAAIWKRSGHDVDTTRRLPDGTRRPPWASKRRSQGPGKRLTAQGNFARLRGQKRVQPDSRFSKPLLHKDLSMLRSSFLREKLALALSAGEAAGSPKRPGRVAVRVASTVAAASLLWVAGGCSGPAEMNTDTMDMATTENPDGASNPDGSTVMGDLPCEVRDLLTKYCVSCHSDPPNKSPMPLVTYAQLVAPSKADPKKSNAERSLIRMQDMTKPMPPGPAATVTQKEIDAFAMWVNAGRPSKKCETMPPDDPFSKPPTCSSGKTYMPGGPRSEMNPGLACITCHKRNGKAAEVTLAGTVYITGHEPDKCLGGPAAGMSAATVEITDANKRVIPLTVNAAGNFLYRDAMPIALPYTAVVKWNGKTRPMMAAQMNTDCNSCHTQDGINGAPGRIALP